VTLAYGESPEQVCGASIQRQIAPKLLRQIIPKVTPKTHPRSRYSSLSALIREDEIKTRMTFPTSTNPARNPSRSHLGLHEADFAVAFVTGPANKHSARLRPSVLLAAWARVFRLAGRLFLPRRIVRARLPAEFEAGRLELGERHRKRSALDDGER
jgi:hypothetical protein